MNDEIHFPRFHYFANAAMRAVFPLFFKMRIEGLERVPKEGPLIVAINHTCFLDPLMSICYLREDILPMAKVELFQFPVGVVFKNYGAFPVRRGEGDLFAMRTALKILRQGHTMLISPEGTRTKTGTLQTPHEGIALIAVKSGAPILPVANWGGKAFATNLKYLRRTPVQMRVGEPLELLPLEGKPTRQVLRSITDELMGHIARLLPPQYRGLYSDAEDMPFRYFRIRAENSTQISARAERGVMSIPG